MNVLDYLLHEKKGYKQYNDTVHKFVLAYLESLNIRWELNIWELTSSKCRTKIRFFQELYDKFVSSFSIRIEHILLL